MEFTSQDYMYIECISILLTYYNIPEKEREEYFDVAAAALKIAVSKNTINPNIFIELIAQEAIALQIGDETRIQPDQNIHYILDTILTYAGDREINIVLNVDDVDRSLASAKLSDLLPLLE